MRDPKRISKVIEKVRELWYYYPDMRFGQLMDYIKHRSVWEAKDGWFYLEDDCIITAINKIIEDLKSNVD